jgi:hypothetical protein
MLNINNIVVSVWYVEYIIQDVAEEDRDFGTLVHMSDGAWVDEIGAEVRWEEFILINEIHPAAPVPNVWEVVEAYFDDYKFTAQNIPWALQMVA